MESVISDVVIKNNNNDIANWRWKQAVQFTELCLL